MFFSKKPVLDKKRKKFIRLSNETETAAFILKNRNELLNIIHHINYSRHNESAFYYLKDQPQSILLLLSELPEAHKYNELIRSQTITLDLSNDFKSTTVLHEIAQHHPSFLFSILSSLQSIEERYLALQKVNSNGESVFYILCKNNLNAALKELQNLSVIQRLSIILSGNNETCPLFLFLSSKKLFKQLLSIIPEKDYAKFFKRAKNNNDIINSSPHINTDSLLFILLSSIQPEKRYEFITSNDQGLISEINSFNLIKVLFHFLSKEQMKCLLIETTTIHKSLFIHCLMQSNEKVDDVIEVIKNCLNLFNSEEEKKRFLKRNSSENYPLLHQTTILENVKLLELFISWLPIELRLETLTKLIIASRAIPTSIKGTHIPIYQASAQNPLARKSIAAIGLENPSFLNFLFNNTSTDEHYPLIYHLSNSMSGQGFDISTTSLDFLKNKLFTLTKDSPHIFAPNRFSLFFQKDKLNRENKQLIASGNTLEQFQHAFNQTIYQVPSFL